MDCIFCKIIKKEIPSNIVYEDDNVLAFLDNNPNSNGHTLIIPKVHYKDLYDIDNIVLSDINNVAKNLMVLYNKKLNPTGYTLAQNNGSAGEVKHYHLHLIPRYDNDLLEHNYNKSLLIDPKIIISKIKED